MAEQERLKAVRSVRQLAVKSGLGDSEDMNSAEEDGME